MTAADLQAEAAQSLAETARFELLTMEDVLAVHRQGVFADECRGCRLANDGRAYRLLDLAKHQQEMLIAAGFGRVTA